MGQPNTGRIEHLIGQQPNSFRDAELFQIINDLDEDIMGVGYSEVIRQEPPLAPFISKITTWDSSGKNKKRVETTFTRNGGGGPFIESVQTDVFKEDGSLVCATITATITRTGDKRVAYTDVQVVRV